MKNIYLLLFFYSIIINATAQQWGDYTLYSVQNSASATLLDTNGNTYHSWTFSNTKKTGYSSYLLPGGDIIRTIANQGNSLNGGGITGAVQKCDWDGNVLWDYVYSSSTYCLHHDICPMPNGNVLLISYDVHTASEMTAAGSSISHTMWLEKILEVEPTGTSGGNIVWEWHVMDHLAQNVDNTKANYVSSILEHPELLNINYQNTNQTQDWMHMNGIDYNPELDQIVFSSHMLNEMYIIDHSTTTAEAATHSGGNSGKGGDILYRWGNPAAYGGTGAAILNVVHDAHYIPAGCPNAGYIVGFNNNGVSNNISCIDEVNVPSIGYVYDVTPGTTLTPTSYTFRRNCTGHTGNMGNSQQLPNGNMLICIAQAGLIYEIDPNGTTIWSKTITGTVPQAFRYTACYINGTTPETPTITLNGTVLTSSSGSSYQWYNNGSPISGAMNQSYTPILSGSYQVAVVETGNCTSALSNAIEMTIDVTLEISKEDLILYPNPSDGMIRIKSSSLIGKINVYNIEGSIVYQNNNRLSFDLSHLPAGIYCMKIVVGEKMHSQFFSIEH